MPERVNLTRSNKNVAEMVVRLSSEIERITFQPEKIIAERGKLKALLVAILAAGTCWIYRNETARFIAEQELLKNVPLKKTESQRLGSNLASQLLRKVVLNRTEAQSQQGSLF
jgi:antitoxin (DNA-binding transcriptional repressor) of toxin-antitoxin stability system